MLTNGFSPAKWTPEMGNLHLPVAIPRLSYELKDLMSPVRKETTTKQKHFKAQLKSHNLLMITVFIGV